VTLQEFARVLDAMAAHTPNGEVQNLHRSLANLARVLDLTGADIDTVLADLPSWYVFDSLEPTPAGPVGRHLSVVHP